MRKIEWKRILLAKEYFYTSLFNFQSEQLVVNFAGNIKLKNCRIRNFFCTNEHLRNGRRTETAQKSISESDAKRAEVLIYNSAQNISDFVLSKVLLQRLLDVEHYQQSSNIYEISLVLRAAVKQTCGHF